MNTFITNILCSYLTYIKITRFFYISKRQHFCHRDATVLWIVSRVLLCSLCVALQLLGCLNGFLATTIKKSPTPSILLLQSSSYFTVSTIETKLTIIKTWKGAYHSEKIKTVSSLHLIHPFTRKGWSEGGKKERESERARFSSPQATVINLHPVRLWLKRYAQAKATHALFSSESLFFWLHHEATSSPVHDDPFVSVCFRSNWRKFGNRLHTVAVEQVICS